MKYKLELILLWIKQAWAGCFNVSIHAVWMIDARVEEQIRKEYFEKALRSLAAKLLRSGVVNIHQSYNIHYDADAYRADLKQVFESRKIH